MNRFNIVVWAIVASVIATSTLALGEPERRFPVRVQGTGFAQTDGQPFAWRGITAFRLAAMIASGREREAAAYLDWASSQSLTVVRVLLMAKHLFELEPAKGRAALPRLLDLARARGIAVEVVALADTGSYALDYDAHVREIGRIAAAKGNAFVEIANEPGHPTQDERLHDPAFAKRLAELIPDPVVVALGSLEYGERYADGDYATTHVPRGEGWENVLAVAKGAELVARLRKPVVSDEPIGAGPKYEEGRRDNVPARFAAAAALTALTGMAATFHYEGGLYGRIPKGAEAASLEAWKQGLSLIDEARADGEFLQGDAVARIAKVSGARAVFARTSERQATILLIDPKTASVRWAEGWTEQRRAGHPGVLVVTAERRPPSAD